MSSNCCMIHQLGEKAMRGLLALQNICYIFVQLSEEDWFYFLVAVSLLFVLWGMLSETSSNIIDTPIISGGYGILFFWQNFPHAKNIEIKFCKDLIIKAFLYFTFSPTPQKRLFPPLLFYTPNSFEENWEDETKTGRFNFF